MKAVTIVLALSSATAFADYSFCAPPPYASDCQVLWNCACPSGGTTPACTYNPGNVHCLRDRHDAGRLWPRQLHMRRLRRTQTHQLQLRTARH